MRTLSSASAAVVGAATALLLCSPSAQATTPGDNGTVKIHDAATSEELRKNEPHVCEFYLDAFGFDAGQEVTWKIVEMPPTGTKGTEAESGTLTLDNEGHGRSDDLSLSDGHYKLIWNFDGEHGRAKHKVFWTDCEGGGDEPGGKPSPSENPEDPETPEKPSKKPESPGKPSDSPSTPAGGGSEEDDAPGSKPDTLVGNLAETGSSTQIGALSTAAVVLLGTGYLLMRRRGSRNNES